MIWIGTSGFSYKEWRPAFYPADLSEKKFLPFYASRLNSVEINSTFYRLPGAPLLRTWAKSTPASFRFSLKAHQNITHRKRLKLPNGVLKRFLAAATALGKRLGPLLFQLPPNFKRDDERLETFLSSLPRGMLSTLEFRHDSWFCHETYDTLRKHRSALCIHDADDHTTPLELTAPFTCVRLRRSSYNSRRRKEWQQRMRRWAADGVDVYAYFKHEDSPDAPLIARKFAEGLP